jgi:hypothetical protein
MADNWAPSHVNALLFLGIQTFLFCTLYFSPRLIFRFSPKRIHLPNKDYWLHPENKPRTVAIVTAFMWRLGTALFLFLFVVELLSLQANLSQPVRLNERLLFVSLGLFILYTLCWCIKFVRTFRISKK